MSNTDFNPPLSGLANQQPVNPPPQPPQRPWWQDQPNPDTRPAPGGIRGQGGLTQLAAYIPGGPPQPDVEPRQPAPQRPPPPPQSYIPTQAHTIPPRAWGRDDYITQGAAMYPGLAPGPYMPQPRDFPAIIQMVAGGLGRWGSRYTGMPAIAMASFANAYMKARQAGQMQNARIQQMQFLTSLKMTAERQKEESQEYGDAMATYGPHTDEKGKLNPGDENALREALWTIAHKYKDDNMIAVISSQGMDAVEQLARRREGLGQDANKMLAQIIKQNQIELQRAKLDALRQKNQAAQGSSEPFLLAPDQTKTGVTTSAPGQPPPTTADDPQLEWLPQYGGTTPAAAPKTAGTPADDVSDTGELPGQAAGAGEGDTGTTGDTGDTGDAGTGDTADADTAETPTETPSSPAETAQIGAKTAQKGAESAETAETPETLAETAKPPETPKAPGAGQLAPVTIAAADTGTATDAPPPEARRVAQATQAGTKVAQAAEPETGATGEPTGYTAPPSKALQDAANFTVTQSDGSVRHADPNAINRLAQQMVNGSIKIQDLRSYPDWVKTLARARADEIVAAMNGIAQNPKLSGEGVYSALRQVNPEFAETLKGYVDGRFSVPPSAWSNSQYRNHVIALGSKVDPGFNEDTAKVRAAVYKNWAQGTLGNNFQAITVAYRHIEQLREMIKQRPGLTARLVGAYSGSEFLGVSPQDAAWLKDAQSLLGIANREIDSALSKGHPTVSGTQEQAKDIDLKFDRPDVMLSVLDTKATALKAKMEEAKQQFAAGTGKQPSALIDWLDHGAKVQSGLDVTSVSPQDVAAAKQLDRVGQPAARTPTPAAPAAPSAQPAFTDPSGKRWIYTGNNPNPLADRDRSHWQMQ